MIVLGVILLDLGLDAQYQHSVDDRYHRPDHRGCLLCLRPDEPRCGWTQVLVLSAYTPSHQTHADVKGVVDLQSGAGRVAVRRCWCERWS